MTAQKLKWLLLAGFVSYLLSACGGGSSGGAGGGVPNSGPTSVTPPTSGAYNWVLKAEGPTSQLKFGLSLIHPTNPGVEWVIESPNAAVSDAKLLASGNVEAATQTVNALVPFALVYIVGGDVRRVPLQANGTAPKSRAQSSQTSSVCGFVLDAIDHAAPESSRFVVATAGSDGQCSTGDDGAAEVRLSAAAPGITVTPITGARPLAAIRDPATLAPRGWLTATEARFWAPDNGQAVTVRTSANPLLRATAANHRTVLVESAIGLSVLDFSGGAAFTESAVTGVGTTGWQPIGFDSQNFYAFRNSGTETGTWQVLRVARTGGLASVLGSGSGSISVASMGRDFIYVTVLGVNTNQLARMNKRVPGTAAQTLESTPRSTLTTVVTSTTDIHQRWRVTGVGTASPAYSLEFFDEAGATLFSSTGGGFPVLLAGGNSLNFNVSENRSVFVVADRYGARAFGNASLVVMDAQARAVRTIGSLPGTSEFGSDFVFANASGGPGNAMAGFAGRSVNGVVQAAGARVFSFDAGAASSLKYATQQQ